MLKKFKLEPSLKVKDRETDAKTDRQTDVTVTQTHTLTQFILYNTQSQEQQHKHGPISSG